MSETVIRLAPTQSTLRELYLRSGNICAMPKCNTLLIDSNGCFCGEVAHITAADKNGPRFDKNKTNEERRSYDNLMLLCPTCHSVIDKSPDKYPVQMLIDIKNQHESKCGDFLEKIRNSIPDLQDAILETPCENCLKFYKTLGWEYSNAENTDTVRIFNGLLDRLKNLPPETRELLSIMVKHSFENEHHNVLINLFEIQKFIERDKSFIYSHLELMERAGIVSAPFTDGEYDHYHVSMCYDKKNGWNFWVDIKNYCNKESILFSRVIFDLDFSVFDDN